MSNATLAQKVRQRRRDGPMARQENLTGWLWASPWILGFLIFTLGPMVASAYYSFTKYPILSSPEWVGFENYRTMFAKDEYFFQSLKVTLTYAIVSVPLYMAIGFSVAILLNQDIRWVAAWRTIYYLPSVISGVAVALLWQWIFNADFGLINYFLGLVGVKGPGWLLDPTWALPALIIMSLWGIGGGMVIYLAGLQGVPTVLYEAAEIDGAGALQRFIHITLPMVSPVIFFNLVMGLIGALQTFTQAFIMTGGGPRRATYFYMLHLYNNAFQWLKMGYASSLAWVLFFIILALTALVLRSSSAWVFYQGEVKGQ